MNHIPEPGSFIPKTPPNALCVTLFRASALIFGLILFSQLLALIGLAVPFIALIPEFTMHLSIAAGVSLLFALIAELWSRSGGAAKRTGVLALLALAAMAVSWCRFSALEPLEKAEKVYTAPFLVASLNVNVDNDNMRDAVQWAVENRPDVMAFSEVSEHQLVTIRKSLSHIYKHEYKTATQGIFGMSVFSYYPVEGAHYIDDEGAGQPMFIGKVMWDVEPVMLGVVHPMPPFTGEYLKKRDLSVRTLAEALGDGPAVLMGDFNATRASTLMPHLGEKFAYSPKTPFYTVKPYLLDIDHVLHSKEHFLRTQSNASIVDGSDHRLMWSMAILKARNTPK